MSGSQGFMKEFWSHPWGRALLIAATVASVSWAVRETAVITSPVFAAIGSVIVPLALGFTLAYVLTPAVDALHRRGLTRVAATSILFVLLILTSLLTLSIVVPAVIAQTTDIVKRSVEESYYYDENEDGKYSPGEPLVRPLEKDGRQVYFHDANNNGRYDLGERTYDDSDFATLSVPRGIVKEPGFIKKTTDLFDGFQADVESMVGVEPDERSLAFLNYYLMVTEERRMLIKRGLAVAANEVAFASWHRSLKLPKDLPEHITWQRNWPGARWSELQAAEKNIADEQRSTWHLAMAYLGRELAAQHQQLLDKWRKIKSGQGVHSSDGDGILLALQSGLTESQRSEALTYIAELRARQDPVARGLLIAISGPSSADSQGVFQEMVLSINTAIQQQMALLPEYAAGWARDLLGNFAKVLMFSLNLFLIPVYAFFLCLAMPTIRATLKTYIPIKGHDRTLRIVNKIERAVAAFFRGRLIVCIICSFLTWVGFALLQIPYAALFGLLIGFATAVPMAGLVFLVPAILLTIIEGGESIALRASLAICVYGAIQGLEAAVFTPTIMGKEVELHPVLLIVALLLCGSLLGVFGLILAVPIAATVRIFSREFFLPRIREAAGVPDTMVLRRRKEDQSIMTEDIMHPSNQAAPAERKSVTDVDDDLSDFDPADEEPHSN